jgi:tRNA threonylcarbamoyladenosine biosynthesis protein TsaB
MTTLEPLLALDTASPVAAVALGTGERVLAERCMPQAATSRSLLQAIDACLREAGCVRQELAGILVLRGPGSFTGLRIGLATALAVHESLQIPALAVPTLPVLASSFFAADPRPVVACVDALRGEWFCQRFASLCGGWPEPENPVAREPQLVPESDLALFAPARFVGFGVSRWAARLRELDCAFSEPGPLAGVLLRWHAQTLPPWNPASLLAPLYLREAAAARGAVGAVPAGV